MGMWSYDGVGADGKKVSGKIPATSMAEVRKILRSQGIRPKTVTPPSILEFDFGQFLAEKGLLGTYGNEQISGFTKQLSIMLNAGVPIVQSLEIMHRSQGHPAFKVALGNIMKGIKEGQTLADSLRTQKGFSKLYCNLIKAGEAGGILDTILGKLAQHIEKQEKLKAQLKSAMMYPTLVSIVGVGVVYGMLAFVVPQFADMLKDTGQELPFITQVVLNASNFLKAYTLYIIPSAGILIWMLLQHIKTPIGKRQYDQLSMRMPLFGGIIIKGNLASFTRTLSTMLGSGVSLIDALEICAETIDNTVVAGDVRVVKKCVTEGQTLTEPLSKIPYLPEMVSQMVRVGEQTGNVDQMLLKIAEVFENEVDTLVGGLSKLIEPLILVGLGGVIAVILIAMYLPIFMSAGG